jgi:tRNA(Ile)-lysidine synthase
LLFLRREEIERYCREAGVTPRRDPTNDMLAATRNKIRHELMPMLRRLNPRIEEALARFAIAAGEDAEYLADLAAHRFTDSAAFEGSQVSLRRQELRRLPPALASRVVRLAFALAHGAAADLEAVHIEAVLEALSGPPGSHSLPGGVTASIDHVNLIVGKGAPAPSATIEPVALPVPGRVLAGAFLIEARLGVPPAIAHTTISSEESLDADKTGADLTVRSRCPGDRLRPLGLGGEKKLQDILVDAKVPARERDGVPLVCSGHQIVWVVGHCIDERYALHPTSRRAIHLSASVVDISLTP